MTWSTKSTLQQLQGTNAPLLMRASVNGRDLDTSPDLSPLLAIVLHLDIGADLAGILRGTHGEAAEGGLVPNGVGVR